MIFTEAFLQSLDALDIAPQVREQLRQQLKQLIPEPPPDKPLLDSRIALMRTFTAGSYSVAARGLSTAPEFDAYVGSGDIEPLIGYTGRYSMSNAARTQHLNNWIGRDEERTSWVAELAQSLDANDPVEGFDLIQLLFLGNQPVARKALSTAFAAADANNDIAHCNGLLALLDPVRLFLDPESTALLNQMRGRAQARNLFFTEFYQSERYFPRHIDEVINQFALGSDEQWICHLYAPGGMGKTTVLRRLISHRWIVGAQHAPCALLDFDYLDVSAVFQRPGLLGIAMAAQWNEQLEQPLFSGFLLPSFRQIVSLLFRARSDASARISTSETLDQMSRAQYLAGLSNPMRCGILAGASPPHTIEERRTLLDQAGTLLSYWSDKLPEAIARMPSDRPVLLVLDTLEDASNSYGRELLETLQIIASLRQAARQFCASNNLPPVNLRVILSGRHQLGTEHVPEFARAFAGQYRECPLPGLDPAEAGQFLNELIRPDIERRAELIAAMTAKSQGIPFNLSLFADWVNDRDEKLTPEIVERSEEVSTVMLIERTVKRIPYQPLRWIIRYGVVPRLLSLDFLREVMRQPLIDAMSGSASATGLDNPQSTTEQDVWGAEPDFHFDAEALWTEKVQPYIAKRNWIGPGDHPRQAIFRADILQPMRKLLRQQRIFATLHQRSRDWFAQRPGTSGQWNSAALEVLYHTLQLRSVEGQKHTDLLPAIRDLLDDDTLRADPKLRAYVCEELRKPDFSELTPSEQAYVCYRLADSQATEHDYVFTSPDALRSLTKAFDLVGDNGAKVLPPFAHVWRLTLGNVTLSTLVAATHGLPTEDLPNAVLLLAEKFLGSILVEEMLRNLTDTVLNSNSNINGVPGGVMAARLAGYIRERDPEGACHYFEAAAQDFLERGDTARSGNMLRQAASMELGLGRAGRARTLLMKGQRRTAEIELLFARIALARGNPSDALTLLQDSAVIPESVEKHELVAEALSQHMDLKGASEAFDRATLLASKLSDTAALIRIATGQAKLYYWWIRTSPDSTPDEVQSILRRSQDNIATSDALTNETEVWQIVYGRQNVERWRRRALGELGGNTLSASVRLIFALSQVVTPFPVKRWHDLISFAEGLPKTARVAALAEPVLAADPPQLQPRLRDQIADTFEASEPDDEVDRAWYGIRFGELLAWLGLHERAVALLVKCVPVLEDSAYGSGWRAAVYRQRRRIEQRIRDWRRAANVTEVYPPPDPDSARLWWTHWQHTPFRAGAACVENAERAFVAGDLPLMRECLHEAQSGLRQVRLNTAFHNLWNQLNSIPNKPAMPSAVPAPPAPAAVTYAAAKSLHEEVAEDVGFDVVQMTIQSGRIRITRGENFGPRVISAGSATLEVLLRARGIPRRLVATPLEQVVNDLSEFVEESGIGAATGRTGLQIQLSPITCVPWELVSITAPPLFRLPSDWSPARARFEAANIEPIGTLDTVLFAPMSPQDRESPALQCYLTLGAQIRESFDPGTATKAHVLYLASSFIEIPNLNEPAVAGPGWTAASFSSMLRGTFISIQPLVVLDVPVPVTSADFMHQLLLRNYFAQALVDSGAVAGVLATGLHPVPAMAELQKWLIERLSDPGATKIELFDELVNFATRLQLRRHDALFTAGPYSHFYRPTPYA
jgi:hypothetical protein